MNPAISIKNALLFALVVAIATPIGVLSYQYSLSTSQRIEEISIGDIRSNADIQSHDLANSLSNMLADSVNTIEIIAGAPAIVQNDQERAQQLLNRAQDSTADLVDFYMWLDQDGKMLWVSNINQTALEQYRNIDLSYRMYFSIPKENHQLYYSSVVESNDQVNRLYISYPILGEVNKNELSTSPEFKGIIVAAIRTDTLGRFLKSQLSPNLQSEVGLLDNTGIILFNEEQKYVGKNAFGVRFQNYLASIDVELLRGFNQGLDDALEGNSGLYDVSAGSDKVTFAYKPIILEGKQFGILYILAPHTYAADVAPLIDQQKNLSFALVIIVAGAALVAIIVIFTWNKRLQETVSARTTELQSANEKLMAHDKLQKEFINIAAHELRTPVQPLLGVTEMLEHQFSDGNTKEIMITKPEVDMLLRNSRRLLNLSQGLLEVSRIESNTLKLVKEPMDLRLKIETVASDMQSILPLERDVKIRVENKCGPGKEPILVNADREKIFEVLSNLLSNAIKYSADGEILVSLDRGSENSIVVSVKDSGRGIGQDILPRLFTKFATNSETGTGLGLFIAKSIVEAHGGKIWAKNNDGEKGATFSFSLPLIQSAKAE